MYHFGVDEGEPSKALFHFQLQVTLDHSTLPTNVAPNSTLISGVLHEDSPSSLSTSRPAMRESTIATSPSVSPSGGQQENNSTSIMDATATRMQSCPPLTIQHSNASNLAGTTNDSYTIVRLGFDDEPLYHIQASCTSQGKWALTNHPITERSNYINDPICEITDVGTRYKTALREAPEMTEVDYRTSNIAIGSIGVIILACLCGFVVIIDLPNLKRDLFTMIQNVKSLKMQLKQGIWHNV